MRESWKVLIFLAYHGKLSRMNIRAFKIDLPDSVNRWYSGNSSKQDLKADFLRKNDERGNRLVITVRHLSGSVYL